MSFNIGLSGLNAAQSDLNVVSNNVANVNTNGFKMSRAEFSDVYASSAFSANNTAIGNGVLLANVAQQFNQGNLNFTSNSLDMALSGDGFFVVSPNEGSSERLFTRAGMFGVDSTGYVVNSSNQRLQAFPVDSDGNVTSSSLTTTVPLQLPQSAGEPSPSSTIDMAFNLPSSATAPQIAFDPNDSDSFNASTSISVYDSLGQAHVASMYFVKIENTATENPDGAGGDNTVDPVTTAVDQTDTEWRLFMTVDGEIVDLDPTNVNDVPQLDVDNDGDGTIDATINDLNTGQNSAVLVFNSSGFLQTTFPETGISGGVGTGRAEILSPALNFSNGADISQTLTLRFPLGPDGETNVTQFDNGFTINELDQNGYAVGRLSGLDIDQQGNVAANYSNGQTVVLGKVALARFSNPQGLRQIGNTQWVDTINSGLPQPGEAGASGFGAIQSGALEASNVDLTSELVNLITAQRNFQANARSIETANQLTQTVINIR
jgi:flagellar hook protein FlgE